MADPAAPRQPGASAPLDVDSAIAALEAGTADESIMVELEDGHIARADGQMGLPGLLQRLRGYRLLRSLAELPDDERAIPMRPFRAELHPQVAIILDALKKSD